MSVFDSHYLPILLSKSSTKPVVIREPLSPSKFSYATHTVLVGVQHPALFSQWTGVGGHRGENPVFFHSPTQSCIFIVPSPTVCQEIWDKCLLLDTTFHAVCSLFFHARADAPVFTKLVFLVMVILVVVN